MTKPLSEQVAELEAERDDLQRQVQEARDENERLRDLVDVLGKHVTIPSEHIRFKGMADLRYKEPEPNLPRVITADELREGQVVAVKYDGEWERGDVYADHYDQRVPLIETYKFLMYGRAPHTIVLLEDAPQPTSDADDDHRDARVTAETIRASEPGSTWENSFGSVREVWDWNGKALIGRSTGRNSGPAFASDQWGPFTRSTAAPAPRLTVHDLEVAPVGSQLARLFHNDRKKADDGRWHKAWMFEGQRAETSEELIAEGWDDATLTTPEAQ